MACYTSVYADEITANEYSLKTAFLYNFARLVDWPENMVSQNASTMQICLIGDDLFGDALDVLRNKKAHNKQLIVKRHVQLNDVAECQLLFISESEQDNLHKILQITSQYPVLTISELPNFVQQQGHIRFFLRADKTLSLEINLDAIKQSRLKISSRILSLAKIINSDKQAKP